MRVIFNESDNYLFIQNLNNIVTYNTIQKVLKNQFIENETQRIPVRIRENKKRLIVNSKKLLIKSFHQNETIIYNYKFAILFVIHIYGFFYDRVLTSKTSYNDDMRLLTEQRIYIIKVKKKKCIHHSSHFCCLIKQLYKKK